MGIILLFSCKNKNEVATNDGVISQDYITDSFSTQKPLNENVDTLLLNKLKNQDSLVKQKPIPYFSDRVSGKTYYFVVYNTTISNKTGKNLLQVLEEKKITSKININELYNYYPSLENPEEFQGKGLPQLTHFEIRLGVKQMKDVKKIQELYPNTSVIKDTEGYGPAGKGSLMIDFSDSFEEHEIKKIINSLTEKNYLKKDNYTLSNIDSYLFLGSFLKEDQAVKLKNKFNQLTISVKLLELKYIQIDL